MDDESLDPLAGEMRAGDLAVLDQLRARGDDLSQPRHTILFFYRLDDDARDAAVLFDPIAEAGEATGLTVCARDEGKLILEGQLYVHPVALELLLEWAMQWAEKTGVEFDGWECELAAQVA